MADTRCQVILVTGDTDALGPNVVMALHGVGYAVRTLSLAVLNRFLQTDIAEIRIFSRDEKKRHDMRL